MRLAIAPSSLSFTENTYVAKSPCGTACSIAYYYRAGRGQSGPYSVVISEDLENDLVLVVQGKRAFVQKLFDHDAPTEFISLPQNQNEDLLQDIESAAIKKGVVSMRISREGEIPVDIQKALTAP
ncbi:hypothetical protein [Dyella sp. 333MFSha]|nr:hypothetical protein [Dyella sp. 333MFSha]